MSHIEGNSSPFQPTGSAGTNHPNPSSNSANQPHLASVPQSPTTIDYEQGEESGINDQINTQESVDHPHQGYGHPPNQPHFTQSAAPGTALLGLRFLVEKYMPYEGYYDSNDFDKVRYCGVGSRFSNCFRCGEPKNRHHDWNNCSQPCLFCRTDNHRGQYCSMIWAAQSWWDKYAKCFPPPSFVKLKPSKPEAAILKDAGFITIKSETVRETILDDRRFSNVGKTIMMWYRWIQPRVEPFNDRIKPSMKRRLEKDAKATFYARQRTKLQNRNQSHDQAPMQEIPVAMPSFNQGFNQSSQHPTNQPLNRLYNLSPNQPPPNWAPNRPSSQLSSHGYNQGYDQSYHQPIYPAIAIMMQPMGQPMYALMNQPFNALQGYNQPAIQGFNQHFNQPYQMDLSLNPPFGQTPNQFQAAQSVHSLQQRPLPGFQPPSMNLAMQGFNQHFNQHFNQSYQMNSTGPDPSFNPLSGQAPNQLQVGQLVPSMQQHPLPGFQPPSSNPAISVPNTVQALQEINEYCGNQGSSYRNPPVSQVEQAPNQIQATQSALSTQQYPLPQVQPQSKNPATSAENGGQLVRELDEETRRKMMEDMENYNEHYGNLGH